ncbi:hypothetical protein HFP43_07735 [Streptomyces sp. SJ1-7]|nr:hypothetical protein [Streptomyces sp. SJ1-7]
MATDWRSGAEHLTTGPSPHAGAHPWASLLPGQDPVAGGPPTDVPAEERSFGPDAPVAEARRARPLTTRQYGFADGHGDGELFRNPGEPLNDWRPPRPWPAPTIRPRCSWPNRPGTRRASTATRPSGSPPTAPSRPWTATTASRSTPPVRPSPTPRPSSPGRAWPYASDSTRSGASSCPRPTEATGSCSG